MVKFEDLDLDRIVEEVLGGAELERETAAAILNCPDERLGDLLGATLKVREAGFGRRVKLCMLRNARSGICPEDCHYCSQSKLSTADIPVYKLQSIDRLVEGADRAAQAGAGRYCMVTSGRGPDARDVEHLGEACERIRERFPALEICLSLGLTQRDQAESLKAPARDGSITISTPAGAFILKSAPPTPGMTGSARSKTCAPPGWRPAPAESSGWARAMTICSIWPMPRAASRSIRCRSIF